jgi:membrane dipeptidase
VWSRPNAFGHGVPFRFPASPDTGEGLTDAGRALVRRCNALRIAVDTSHLNARGFFDVAALTDAPLIASHSGAHAVCAASRNLTDDQLDAIGSSGGIVGIPYVLEFVRPDGAQDHDTPLSDIVAHVRHVADRVVRQTSLIMPCLTRV